MMTILIVCNDNDRIFWACVLMCGKISFLREESKSSSETDAKRFASSESKVQQTEWVLLPLWSWLF